jgi:pilus assembly protein TadC
MLLAGVATALAVLVVLGRGGVAVRRLPVVASTGLDTAGAASRRWRVLVLAATCGGLLLFAVVGIVGVVVVFLVGAVLLAVRLRRPGDRSVDCALTIDLLAGCVAAGAPMAQAISAAATAAPDELQTLLAGVARALATGAPPATAWACLGNTSSAMAAVARVCTRGMGSGAAVAAELSGIAARERRRRRTLRQQRINRAAVWAVLPLGLCFLPAFVLVGVVPLVVGLLPIGR